MPQKSSDFTFGPDDDPRTTLKRAMTMFNQGRLSQKDYAVIEKRVERMSLMQKLGAKRKPTIIEDGGY